MDSRHCLTDALRLSYRRTTRQPSSLLESSLLHSLLQPWAASGDPYFSVGRSNYLGGDKPLAALKLLQKVDDLNYLVLECLAERTLADRYQEMLSGGEGFDPRISEWIQLLLPLAVEKGVCTITNMGAKKDLEIASGLGIKITVGVAHQFDSAKAGLCSNLRNLNDGQLLLKYNPDVVFTSWVADASLFLAPMVYELGWNWDDFSLLAQGSLAGHLLECGCQLTGGYFMHPGQCGSHEAPKRKRKS
uniref:Acyclic terpene utilisation N-terminal domain-containing protein n=2 Tax=Helianthus annuus TaxID=4232 RepID=A0A251VQQ5_HELAN